MNIGSFIDKISSSSDSYPEETFSQAGRIYTCVNPFKYHIVRKHMDTYMAMDGIFVDGILMCKFFKWIWAKNVKRLSFDMTSMARDLFCRINKSGESIYFIGDSQEMVEGAVLKFRESYPGMNIVGYHSGFFRDLKDREAILENISRVAPNYVIIGMGGLIQEQFALDLRNKGYSGIAFTCGGYFHQASGNLNYYPEWVNRFNLRAPYRIIKEKNYKRLWHVLVSFPLLFLIDSIMTKSRM